MDIGAGVSRREDASDRKVARTESESLMDIDEGVVGRGLSGVLSRLERECMSSRLEKVLRLRECSKVMSLSVSPGVDTDDDADAEDESVKRRVVGLRGERGGSGGDERGAWDEDRTKPPSELAAGN